MSAEATHGQPHGQPQGDKATGPSSHREQTSYFLQKGRLGMICFIASEIVFFLMLILAYLYYQAKGISGPNAYDALKPNITNTIIFTAFLFSSSATVWFAGRALLKGNRIGAFVWLVITIVLGGIFLGGQVSEYIHLYDEKLTINRNLFGSSFFTLTGFHGAHVFGGLVMLTVMAVLTLFKPPRTVSHDTLETVSLYWHFVDVVWVAVFSVVYLPILLKVLGVG